MERIYRLIFLGLFVLGFIGAVASADHTGDNNESSGPTVASLIRDVRLAEEINSLNKARWNQDVTDINQDGLARVEDLMKSEEQGAQEQANTNVAP